ncbi:MAG: hypothetical protein U0556_01330 [Dehalococcoidia bacterium]
MFHKLIAPVVAIAAAVVVSVAPSAAAPVNPPNYRIEIEGNQVRIGIQDEGAPSVYSGTVWTDGRIRGGVIALPEAGDRVSSRRGTLTFRVSTGDGRDGVAFAVEDGEGVRFLLQRNGTPIDPSQIILPDGSSPTSNPFHLPLY